MRYLFIVTGIVCLAASVVAVPQAAGTTCFDVGNCILSGGGTCVHPVGSLTGTCNKSGATTTGDAAATALAPASTSTAGGASCFDDGDCILSGGGQCVKPAGALLGTCGPKA